MDLKKLFNEEEESEKISCGISKYLEIEEEKKTSRNLHKMKLEFEAVSLVEASLCV